MSNNDLVVQYDKLAQRTGYEKEELKVLQSTVAKNTSIVELEYFLNVCKSVGLNPFNKEIWCYKDQKDNLIIFTGRDGLLKKSQTNADYAGMRSAEIREKDEFSADIPNGKIEHKITSISNEDRGQILGAYAIVFRKDGEPTIELADFKTYAKLSHYGPWKTHGADMIKKVAEAHALKKAFGFSGIQLEDDWTITDNTAEPIDQQKAETKKDITDEDFNRFLDNSDAYIEKYADRYNFTKEQSEKVEERLGGAQ